MLGNGHPVVFLHGFLESSAMWEYLNLEHCQALLIDLPGHGDSTIDESETIQTMAIKVLDVVNQLNIERFDIVGHSMGGYVALEIAKNTNRCERVMLMNSNFWEDSPSKKNDRNRVAEIVHSKKSAFLYEAIPNLFSEPFLFDKDIKKLLSHAVKMTAESIAICSLVMRDRLDNSQLMSMYPDKFLVVQGRYDRIVPLDEMQKRMESLDLDFCIIEAGHMAYIENKMAMQQVLNNWIKKTETN